jgi:hypothetical protein
MCVVIVVMGYVLAMVTGYVVAMVTYRESHLALGHDLEAGSGPHVQTGVLLCGSSHARLNVALVRVHVCLAGGIVELRRCCTRTRHTMTSSAA